MFPKNILNLNEFDAEVWPLVPESFHQTLIIKA